MKKKISYDTIIKNTRLTQFSELKDYVIKKQIKIITRRTKEQNTKQELLCHYLREKPRQERVGKYN